MKKLIFLFLLVIALQSCYYPVRKDYGIYSKSLVFSKDKKWLINDIRTGVSTHHREMMSKEVLELFQKLSNGKASDLKTAKAENIIQNSIPFEPEIEDLEVLKNNSDYNFLVNIYTLKVRNSLDNSIGLQYEYKKNETFAMMEVYDIGTMKKIYSLKASSEVSVEKDQKATVFDPSTEMMTMKNFRALLKSLKKNAVKTDDIQ
ncbi:hypothetical protein CRN76_01560 [Chryseobacterium indologenes]|jgi:hypothetical protein|uniref:hypothetical protein n=1 Tax=Chryseobacterium TaxID=59732 RepID=UPI000480984E|nr:MULTISPECIES: hypothetical protein [Chryseobacterium]ATN04201.1 hypothetical protein CRN76_01560 [Chryseobacterium indologenes]AYY83136.1 hypothetical protein EGX91_00340 [Chryseobacterium indologenes]QIX80040.1 hypothetical protein FOB56_01705 [Chryseobacterium indologenes]TLX26205.1 hypothetical protein FE904_08630 [Chryseobacterium indologenes]UDQ53678.1 hypothetical protein LJF28_19980 [Chryseobacterium indologenes]